MKNEDEAPDDLPDDESPPGVEEIARARAHARAIDGVEASLPDTADSLLAADVMRAAATPPPLDPDAAARIRRELVTRASHRAGLRGRVRAFLDRLGPGWMLVPALAIMLLFLRVGSEAPRDVGHSEDLARVAGARAASPPAGRPGRSPAQGRAVPRILRLVAMRRAGAEPGPGSGGASTTWPRHSPGRPAPSSGGPGPGLALALLAVHGRDRLQEPIP